MRFDKHAVNNMCIALMDAAELAGNEDAKVFIRESIQIASTGGKLGTAYSGMGGDMATEYGAMGARRAIAYLYGIGYGLELLDSIRDYDVIAVMDALHESIGDEMSTWTEKGRNYAATLDGWVRSHQS